MVTGRYLAVAIAAILLWAVARPSFAGALEWVTRPVAAPRVTQNFFNSDAAGTRISYHIYLPAAYAEMPQRQFPVVYWLHGSGGGEAGIPIFSRYVDKAIGRGDVPPFIVVFVNGLKLGMYVDWKDGSAPMETIIVRELLPHIDKTYRTIADRGGRLLDGFSMGGYGAARFGFKYPELFASVSLMGAGPLQANLTADAPRMKKRAEDTLRRTYGNDPAYFIEVSPRTLAAENARQIAETVRVRMVIGSRDETFANNKAFHQYLETLGIPHEWIVLDKVGHSAEAVLRALGDRQWAFYRAAFGSQ